MILAAERIAEEAMNATLLGTAFQIRQNIGYVRDGVDTPAAAAERLRSISFECRRRSVEEQDPALASSAAHRASLLDRAADVLGGVVRLCPTCGKVET